MSNSNHYRVKCTKCGEELARGTGLNSLLERFFQLVARHNLDDMDHELCPNTKQNLSIDDLRGAFAGDEPEYVVEKATEYSPISWSGINE